MNKERSCSVCEYYARTGSEYPCSNCYYKLGHPNFEAKKTKTVITYRSCITCEFEKKLCTAHPCSECYREGSHPNYKPKQVYISTADNRKNDLLDAARYAMQAKDTESLYPTLKFTPIKVDPKELELVMEKMTPLNPLYGITQYIDKDVKITSDLLKRMEAEMEKEMKEPKNVIFNDPATIVFWHDGTKTVVKAIDEPFDPEKGLAMAIAKKYLGNKHEYYNVFKKHLKKYEKEEQKLHKIIKEAIDNVDETSELPECIGVGMDFSTVKCKSCSYTNECWDEYCKRSIL